MLPDLQCVRGLFWALYPRRASCSFHTGCNDVVSAWMIVLVWAPEMQARCALVPGVLVSDSLCMFRCMRHDCSLNVPLWSRGRGIRIGWLHNL